jgi:hypothetical protein
VVPIYTKVQSITAEPRYGGTVVMNGLDREYHSPDGIGEFLDYVKIGATKFPTIIYPGPILPR